MQMVDKGRGGGCRTFNRGRRRGLSLGAPITTNPSTSSIHVSTSESMIHVIAPTPNTLPTAQDQPNPTFVRESIPITPVRDASPSAPDDSLTLEYPSDPNCFNQHMSVLISYQISLLITEKFDEPAASWLKKEYRWHPQEERAIRAIFETKGSCILKSAMNKIRNGQDKGKWITDNVRAALDEHWGSTDFLNKSSTAKANRSIDRGALAYYGEPYLLQLTLKSCQRSFKDHQLLGRMEKTKKLKSGKWVNDKSREFAEKYQHCQYEILQHSTEEGTSTQDSLYTATSVNDNEIYLNVVGAPNYKGNMYGLGTLSKQFSCSKSAPSTSIAPVEDQIKEMCETINKLNAELLAKANKEKTLEEKMLQLMENHDHQSQEMRQQMQEQNEQIRQQNEQL
ncbi:uncharacterized protein LOC114384072 [Glycine soja]|uniref:uncharacterized protein LOC114384072 n=1 Tax=Glycine soja TaxID=3848 RepID=UPI001039E91A|nr:uncharacterized protein LOC114384072 [Glycine soja]